MGLLELLRLLQPFRPCRLVSRDMHEHNLDLHILARLAFPVSSISAAYQQYHNMHIFTALYRYKHTCHLVLRHKQLNSTSLLQLDFQAGAAYCSQLQHTGHVHNAVGDSADQIRYLIAIICPHMSRAANVVFAPKTVLQQLDIHSDGW